MNSSENFHFHFVFVKIKGLLITSSLQPPPGSSNLVFTSLVPPAGLQDGVGQGRPPTWATSCPPTSYTSSCPVDSVHPQLYLYLDCSCIPVSKSEFRDEMFAHRSQFCLNSCNCDCRMLHRGENQKCQTRKYNFFLLNDAKLNSATGFRGD